ncbi:hypothetical protein ACFYZE_32295 [Streptomyces sp. NPDC001796]|uniref:hypothetical protein n=1 Tax=Streptomyces sp. NPDC001796 TaxID=3364609 RepID=UPI0036C2DF89
MPLGHLTADDTGAHTPPSGYACAAPGPVPLPVDGDPRKTKPVLVVDPTPGT